MMKTPITLTLLLTLVLSSCTGGINQLIDGNREQYILDPSFGLFELYQADVYFGGFTPLEDTPNKAQLSDIAINSLISSRQDIRWQTHHTFAAMVGNEKATQLQQFSTSNFASVEAKTALQEATYPSSYVIFSRMLSNDTYYEEDENHGTDYNGKRIIERVYRAVRKGTIQTDVYDLNTQEHVWSAVLEHEESNERTSQHKPGSILENILVGVVDSLVTSIEPPSNEELIKTVFKKVGGQLPQRKCSEIGFTECMKRSSRQN